MKIHCFVWAGITEYIIQTVEIMDSFRLFYLQYLYDMMNIFCLNIAD